MSEDLKMKFIQELSKGNVSIGQLIMEVHGDNHYYEKDYQPKTGKATTKDAAQESVSSELMVNALKQCGAYIWGNSAYSIAFCVCRDIYHMGDNATQYERILSKRGIMLPAGTINTTINRNHWMKYPIESWEENGASERALRLRNAFIQQVKMMVMGDPKNGMREKEC